MVFWRRVEVPDVLLDDITLKVVDKQKYLGVKFDSKLDQICKKKERKKKKKRRAMLTRTVD